MKPQSQFNRHHILHSEKAWNADSAGMKLRRQPSLIFEMDREAHKELHQQTPAIPVLSHYAILGTLANYYPTYKPEQDIDSLCKAIEYSVDNPRTHKLERNLAELAIEGIQLEKPLILDGLRSPRLILV